MKSKNKNILTLVSGGLLLAALVTYLLNPLNPFRDFYLIVAAVIAGVPIAIKAVQALRLRAFSIDLLVTIAVVGALIIGEYTEAAVVSFLFLFGDYLEGRTLNKTRSALKSLMDMAPLEATILKDGNRITVPVDEVKVGDHVIVQPGARIPVDGQVLTGRSFINESAITGESVLVLKRKGDQVFSSTVSDDGYLEILAEKVGGDTTFSKIIELVEEAQETKAPTQKFMERFAAYYTPAILILSILVGLFTQNTHLALTFLVIACPGALVISVPVSIVAGIGNGAKNGILFKGGDKMENLAKVDTVVFDKTGTLTQGKPMVTDIKTFGPGIEEVLKLAAEVEMASEHPLGKAKVEEAGELGLELDRKPSEVEILKGHGMRAKLESAQVYIGNLSGATKSELSIDEEVRTYMHRQQKKGTTPVLVAVDGEVRGIISIADRVRSEASTAVHQLRENGIERQIMLTGDNEAVARQVADKLGVDEFSAELLPDEKVNRIKGFKKSGHKVAMVGDGINDAPSIATADVGIAMGGTATDVTMQTADVILMSDNLDKLPYAIQLAKATVRNMKQNTAIALITVVFLLVGVLMNHIHLASGMLIHEISVIVVIVNAIRLVYFPNKYFGLRKSWSRLKEKLRTNERRNLPVGEF